MLRKENSLSIHTHPGSKRLKFRPKSTAAKKKYVAIKINNNSGFNSPPPILFTMPNNRRMKSSMGKKMEIEQLYEYNLQLRDTLNKLKKELAETKYQVVKKEIELREKEKIIRSIIRENDADVAHEEKFEKAKESALLTMCKDKYNILRNTYEKECEENKILKANIKLTKIKEFQIENDILNKEIRKIRALYDNCKKVLKKYKNMVKELKSFKTKFLEQHTIISSYSQKCDLLNAQIETLRQERDLLQKNLDSNIKRQEKLKISNNKLKFKNIRFLNQKKAKEDFNFKSNNYQKTLNKLESDAKEFKSAFYQKLSEYKELKEQYETLDQKYKILSKTSLKPFKYDDIKHIEKENDLKNIDKIELYKSLYDESQMKIVIYEKYFKEKNIKYEDIIRDSGYNGILNSENRLLLLNQKNLDNINLLNQSFPFVRKENEKNSEKINQKNEDNMYNINNAGNTLNNNAVHYNTNEINVIKEEEEENRETINQVEPIRIEERSNPAGDNASATNTNTKANTNYNNNNFMNNNLNNDNNNNNIGEEENYTDLENEIKNKFLTLIHLFLKNFEANRITTTILDEKMQNIFKFFEGKSETSSEEFLKPFINLFYECMKVTQESDKQIVQSFLTEYFETLNEDTKEFLNELFEIFENLVDYTPLENNEFTLNSLALNLQKYKDDLEKKLKEEDEKGTHIITFDIFKKIVNEINLHIPDDLMEFLLFKMKSSVPPNYSIFDLNYEFILDCLKRKVPENFNENANNENDDDNLSRQISSKLSQFKFNMADKNTDLEKVCKDYVQTFNDNGNEYDCIEKDKFFEIMEQYGVTVEEELKEAIYMFFINEEPVCTKGSVAMMDYKKLKELFLNDYIE